MSFSAQVKQIFSSFATNPASIFFTGLVCQLIAGLGLWKWSRSEWLTFGGPFPSGWEGYTLLDWFALAAFLFLGPMGFCLTFTSFQYYTRVSAKGSVSNQRLIIPLIGIISLSCLLAFGWYWGWDLLQCGVIGCVNTDWHTWEGTKNAKPEAGIGFKTTIGIPIVITSISLIITIIAAWFDYNTNSTYHQKHNEIYNKNSMHTSYSEPLLLSNSLEEEPLPKNTQLKRYTPYNTHLLSSSSSSSSSSSNNTIAMPDGRDTTKMGQFRFKYWVWFLVYAIFLFLWWFFAGYVPNNWEYFYPARIAEKALLRVSNDGELCQTQWRNYTCPETPGALMTTQGWQLTKYVQIKIFPSNLLFYVFLLSWTLVAVASKSINERVTRFFATKIRVPVPFSQSQQKRDRLAFFTIGELASLVFVSVVVYFFFHYWFWDHNYVNYWPNKDGIYGIAWSERFSRTFGQVAVFFFALLMFPAARNSPLLAMVGVSWEASIQYHRWLGAAFFVFVIGHMFATYWWYYVSGDLKDIFQIPQTLPTSVDNFTVPLIQYCVWFSIFSIGVGSMFWQQFRRKHFDLWMFLHHFTYLTMIPAILWHAQASWEYIMPATTIWFFDRLVRAYRSVRAVNLVTAAQASASTGEKYHTVNPFNPDSIDIRIQTPDPITSIHHHKNYSQLQVYFQPIDAATHTTSPSNRIPMSSSFVHSSSSLTNVSLNAQDVALNQLNRDSSDTNSDRSTGILSALNVSGPGVRIVDRGEAGTYIELRIVNDNMCYFPGHYAFLNIAEISVFEWHPFTIASPAHFRARSEILFVIKTMGVGTWTQSLYNYVLEHQKSVGATSADFVDIPLTVSLDGPYGTPIDFTTYDIVILLGGGIGITPCKSIYESLLLSYLHDFKARLMYQYTRESLADKYNGNTTDSAGSGGATLSEPNTNPLLNNLNINAVPLVSSNKRIHLMWSSRDPMLFELMSESLSQVPYGPFSAQLYCDNPTMTKEQDEHLLQSEKRVLDPNIISLIQSGRPDLEQEFKAIVHGLNPNSYLSGSHDDGESTMSSKPQLNSCGRPTGPVDPTSNQHGGSADGQTKRVLVFVCGPGPMAQDAEIICQENGWDFHTETFAL